MRADRRIAEFRRRLAEQDARWLIDIEGAESITIDLTRRQQAQLRRATEQTFSSATFVFQGANSVGPVRTALCNLVVEEPPAAKAGTDKRRRSAD